MLVLCFVPVLLFYLRNTSRPHFIHDGVKKIGNTHFPQITPQKGTHRREVLPKNMDIEILKSL